MRIHFAGRSYAERRARQYPSLAEFAEAYTERELGDDTKWRAYLDKVKAVRARFPKPKGA